MLNTGQHLTLAIIWFKHIYSYYHLHSNIHIYSLQYNHDGIQKKVKRLIAIFTNPMLEFDAYWHISHKCFW